MAVQNKAIKPIQPDEKEEMIPVSGAFLQAAIFLPGHTESTLNPQRMPGIEMGWIPGEGLMVNFKGQEVLVPSTNVKCVLFDKRK